MDTQRASSLTINKCVCTLHMYVHVCIYTHMYMYIYTVMGMCIYTYTQMCIWKGVRRKGKLKLYGKMNAGYKEVH